MNNYLFTSESVTEGHPDKVCDQISDSVLDAILAQDPSARVACESFCTTDRLVIMGEITTTANVDYAAIARKTICNIGYDRDELGFNGNTCDISVAVHTQSPDIAMGVDRSLELKAGEEDELNLHGAGDQGMMFGFACDETKELMPLSASLSHALSKKLAAVRKEGTLTYLRPDGKSQVTVEYKNGKPARVDTIVVSTQHDDGVSLETIRKDITEQIIAPIIPADLMDEHTKIFVNPTGNFVVGGPAGDTGLTGRKIIVDTYGGAARHGGGAFSGKDPTKVDRSAAYAAHWVAKNVVAAGLASKCEVQLAYAIGVANPVSVMVDTFGTATVAEDAIVAAVNKVFDLRPEAIIRRLNLRQPIYTNLAAYGHMGREELGLAFEQTDMVDALKAAL
jgi:S-adenosylmethionine synthetase